MKKIALAKIHANPENPRFINDLDFEKLVNSIKSFPEMLDLRPIVVDEEGMILGGNMRLRACHEAGLKTVPVIVAKDLTEEQKSEFIIKDNLSFGKWDWDILANEWSAEDLEEWGLDTSAFDSRVIEPGEQDDYEIPEEIQTDIVLGDVIEIGNHRLICGDSTDSDQVARLMGQELAGLVFTDPPYGVSFVGIKGTMYQGGKKKGRDGNEQIKGDELRGEQITEIFNDSLKNAYLFTEKTAPFYIFFAINKSEDTIKAITGLSLEIRNWLIWDKGNVGFHAMGAQYKPNYESFLYCFKSGSPPVWQGDQQQQTIWRHSVERLGLHPTMKPIALICQAINNHETKLILDPFLGSGSTMVAAQQLGLRCNGLELDPKFCQVIIERMQKLEEGIEIKINGQDYD